MEWKKVDVFDGTFIASTEAVIGAIRTSMSKIKGKYVRVTIEEAVDECCEKWRAFLVGNDKCRDCSHWLPVARTGMGEWHWRREGPVAFCPECGKKL